jgi:3-oxoacyl-[acyl-carrier protein] reductase
VTDISLERKVLLVTGGARGLGQAMALGFAKANAAGVAIVDINSDAAMAEVVSEIRNATGAETAIALVGDVTKPSDCQKAVEETIARFGRVDGLVNNAARGNRLAGGEDRPFWEADSGGYRNVIETNIVGPFNMAKAVAPHLIKQGWGRIINITKSREAMHQGLNAPYGPSKAAMEAATISWAQDMLETGVTVNSLLPGGAVDTDFLSDARREKGRSTGRFMTADVIVPAAVWLASNLSDGITGCRYVGKYFDATLPPDEAAEAAREESVFRRARRPDALTRTWEVTESPG